MVQTTPSDWIDRLRQPPTVGRSTLTCGRSPATGSYGPAPFEKEDHTLPPSPRRPRSKGPDQAHERSLLGLGFDRITGIDEVGRGAWAGPVSVGVVVFPPDGKPPVGVRDSKELSEERREALFPLITSWCTDWAVGHADPGECDRLGMTAALRLAAERALTGLRSPPGAVLLDGGFDYLSGPQPRAEGSLHVRTVVRGDAACVSIAAASIVAKVTRDRAMRTLAPSFPAFDFDRNKGYPSPAHQRALAGIGLTSIHRRSWSFVDQLAFR
jgi:ribonuclease HII